MKMSESHEIVFQKDNSEFLIEIFFLVLFLIFL